MSALSVALRHQFAGFDLDVSFEAPPGATVLFGRSGSGKTTIVNAVAGLLTPEAGRASVGKWVLFDQAAGMWLPPHRRRLGYIFQEGRLFPHLTVRRNLLYGRWFAPREAGDNLDEVAKIVEILDLGHLLDRRPGALSGGEKQRVAIGRALLARPRLLLADEPLAALDQARKAEILPYFERLRDELSIPILYVTHSVAEAARLATTVVALKDGRVAQMGPAAELFSDPEAATALGVRAVGSILSGRVVRLAPDGLAEVKISGGVVILPSDALRLGEPLRVRIEAQDVILALERPERISALNILPAKVAAIRPGRGPGVIVALAVGQDQLLARITRRSCDILRLKVGDGCFAVVKSVSVARMNVGRGG